MKSIGLVVQALIIALIAVIRIILIFVRNALALLGFLIIVYGISWGIGYLMDFIGLAESVYRVVALFNPDYKLKLYDITTTLAILTLVPTFVVSYYYRVFHHMRKNG